MPQRLLPVFIKIYSRLEEWYKFRSDSIGQSLTDEELYTLDECAWCAIEPPSLHMGFRLTPIMVKYYKVRSKYAAACMAGEYYHNVLHNEDEIFNPPTHKGPIRHLIMYKFYKVIQKIAQNKCYKAFYVLTDQETRDVLSFISLSKLAELDNEYLSRLVKIDITPNMRKCLDAHNVVYELSNKAIEHYKKY